MIIAAAHHWVDGAGLLLAGVRVVGVVAWDDEVVHLLLQNLLPRRILNVATSGARPILTTDIVLLVLDAVLHPKISEPIEFLTARTILVASSIENLSLLWHNTHRIDHHGEVLFQMGRAQHLQL